MYYPWESEDQYKSNLVIVSFKQDKVNKNFLFLCVVWLHFCETLETCPHWEWSMYFPYTWVRLEFPELKLIQSNFKSFILKRQQTASALCTQCLQRENTESTQSKHWPRISLSFSKWLVSKVFLWTHGRILGVYAEVQQVCIKDGSFSSFIHVERKMNFVCDQENISGFIDFFFSIKIWWKAFK